MHSSKQSQSFIHQSIVESRTHHLDIPPSTHYPTNHALGQTRQQKSGYNSNPTQQSRTNTQKFILDDKEKPFIHYYEENIKLKKKQQEMNREMTQLRSRLSQQARNRRELDQKQLKMLAEGKKSLWDKNKANTYTRGTSYKGKGRTATDNRKTEDLLEIIDHYKSKLVTAQQQIQNLKRKNHLLEQDKKLQDKRTDNFMKSHQQSSYPVQQEKNLEEKLKTTIRHLEIQKQRNKYNQTQIRRLETKIKNLSISGEEIEDLKLQNRNLEEKMLRLTQLPSFSNITNKVDEQRKYKELESKYKNLNEKFNTFRNDKIKIEAQVKLLQNKLIEVNQEADSLDKQNRKLKSESIDNPILSKLSKDPKLLAKIYYDFEQQSKNPSKKQSQQNYEKIILEKQILADQINSLRMKIEAMQENYKEKQRIYEIEKQQLADAYKTNAANYQRIDSRANKVKSMNGVAYSDDVSMFSQENNTNVPVGFNYFDLYLGQLHLLDTMLKSAFNIHSGENSLVLATVDFYNHDTENTKPVHGSKCNFQSEFSFKVQEDQFFIKYLKKGGFYIDIWGLEGNKRHHFGRTNIDLKPLIGKSRKGLAPVVASSVPIYLNQKVMGSFNISMRMRMPIHEQLQKVNLTSDILESSQKSVNRRLIIHIEEGRGFNESSNSFVYYPFRLQDYYTKTFRGSNPAWNHYKPIELQYNTDLKNYLRKNQLELVVIDDNAIETKDGSDVIGTAYVSLLPLLQNKSIKQRTQVMKGAHRCGTIDIKVYWHDTEQPKESKLTKTESKTSIQEKLLNFLTQNKMEPEDIFRSVDRNDTGMISYDQFLAWMSKLMPGTQLQAIGKLYGEFRQPVNLVNWVSKFSEMRNQHTKDLAEELSRINQEVVFKHNYQIEKQTLKQYLKGKDLVDISLQIDKTGDGRISKKQLLDYFQEHGIEEDVEEQQIQIVKFLKKYQNYA